MKRFLLFSGQYYYPLGGWADFIGDFDTLQAAQNATAPGSQWEWAQIVDSEIAEVVWERP